MTYLGKSVLTLGFLNCCLAIAQNAPAPLSSASAYPSSTDQKAYSIGARQLSKTEVKNSFATPLANRYVVVEIGFYPSGNFHAQALAFALDSVAIAFTQLGNLSEKRLHRRALYRRAQENQ